MWNDLGVMDKAYYRMKHNVLNMLIVSIPHTADVCIFSMEISEKWKPSLLKWQIINIPNFVGDHLTLPTLSVLQHPRNHKNNLQLVLSSSYPAQFSFWEFKLSSQWPSFISMFSNNWSISGQTELETSFRRNERRVRQWELIFSTSRTPLEWSRGIK